MIKFKDIAHFYFGCFIMNKAGQVARLNEIYCHKPGYFPEKPVTTYGLVEADLSFDQFKPILKPAAIALPISVQNNIPLFIKEQFEASVDLFGLLDTDQAITPDKIDLELLGEELREEFINHFDLPNFL